MCTGHRITTYVKLAVLLTDTRVAKIFFFQNKWLVSLLIIVKTVINYERGIIYAAIAIIRPWKEIGRNRDLNQRVQCVKCCVATLASVFANHSSERAQSFSPDFSIFSSI